MATDSFPRRGARRTVSELTEDVERLTREAEAARIAVIAANERADSAAAVAQASAQADIERAKRRADLAEREASTAVSAAEARVAAANERTAAVDALRARAVEEGRHVSKKLAAAAQFIDMFAVGDQRKMQAALLSVQAELERRRETLAEVSADASRQAEQILAAARTQAETALTAARDAAARQQAATDHAAAQLAAAREEVLSAAQADADLLREQGRQELDAARASAAEMVARATAAAADAERADAAVAEAYETLARLNEQAQQAVLASPDAALYLQYGLFQGLGDSAAALDANRSRQEELVASGEALTGAGDSAELRQLAAVVLRGYNAEVEAILHSVSVMPIAEAVKRLARAKAAIDELGLVAIAPEYHALRVQEVELVSRQGV